MKRFFCVSAVLALGVSPSFAATEQEIIVESAKILREFRSMPEREIPAGVLREAEGLAIMRVIKVGLGISGKGGEGVVVARTRQGWSGPSFVGTGGIGWGAQIGAQVTDFVFVLNTREAVRAFAQEGNVTLGADISAAAGPVGRNLQAGVVPTAAIYTYSRSRGLFAGVSLEGAVIATQRSSNRQFYQRPVSARDILTGKVPPPRRAAPLLNALRR